MYTTVVLLNSFVTYIRKLVNYNCYIVMNFHDEINLSGHVCSAEFLQFSDILPLASKVNIEHLDRYEFY